MKKILVATDFSPIATEALRYAGALAAQTGAQLVALYADTFEPPREFTARDTGNVASAIAASQQRAEEELERCVADNVPPGVPTQVMVVEGHPAPAIVGQAARLAADAIVIGSHGRNALQRMLLGSVSARVATESAIPVIIVPQRKEEK